VKPLLSEARHAVWLLPTPEFRIAAFDGRQNLFERDRLFTDRLRAETRRLGLPVIEVGGAMSEDQLVDAVAHSFGL
jgi:hypothetical protein